MKEGANRAEQLQMSAGTKTATGGERGHRESGLDVQGENWIWKQQREGRGRQEEIAGVEWQENEGG